MPDGHQEIQILMYHSISNGSGPTSISPSLFREQLVELANCGYEIVPITDLIAWTNGDHKLAERTAVLTFDDGFADFATAAFPELRSRGWPCTVYLPTGKLGGIADWDGDRNESAPRQLMTWNTILELRKEGVDFGGHSVTHVDLTALPVAAMRSEVADCKKVIEERTNGPVSTFAAPFGRVNATVIEQIQRHYQAAAGTTLGRMTSHSSLFDLPRIEMWYFRDIARWRAYLGGKRSYYLWRKALRMVRGLIGAS